jgi:hypothetical protein
MRLEFLSVEGAFTLVFETFSDCTRVEIGSQNGYYCRYANPNIVWQTENDTDYYQTPDDVRQFIDKAIANKAFL